jgi:hypothetical protein
MQRLRTCLVGLLLYCFVTGAGAGWAANWGSAAVRQKGPQHQPEVAQGGDVAHGNLRRHHMDELGHSSPWWRSGRPADISGPGHARTTKQDHRRVRYFMLFSRYCWAEGSPSGCSATKCTGDATYGVCSISGAPAARRTKPSQSLTEKTIHG